MPATRSVWPAATTSTAPSSGTTSPSGPATRPRIGYVGSLYPGRGIELIIERAGRLPAYEFELIGGSEADLAPAFDAVMTLALLAFPTVGALVASRHPGNVIGWLFCAVGIPFASTSECRSSGPLMGAP